MLLVHFLDIVSMVAFVAVIVVYFNHQVSDVDRMDDATMRQEWFGGEFSGEVWDPQLKM